MADDDYSARPERVCVGCGKRDKAPRDVVALPDGNTAYYHMDCHVMIADCAVCKEVLRVAKDKKNEDLAKFLTDDRKEEIFTTPNAANNGVVLVKDGDK